MLGNWYGTSQNDHYTNKAAGVVGGNVDMTQGGADTFINKGAVMVDILMGSSADTVHNYNVVKRYIKTGGGNDTIRNLPGAVAEYIYGEDGDDFIMDQGTVNQGIFGGNGRDHIIKYDLLRGSIWGEADDDTIDNYGTIKGGIYGATGNDAINNYGTVEGSISGAGGQDTIENEGIIEGSIDSGNQDDDIRHYGLVKGDIIAGNGADYLFISSSGQVNGDVNLGAGNDRMVCLGVTDSIYGGAGNDVFTCNLGSDVWDLHGGDGNDSIYVRNLAASLFGDDGDDTIWVYSTASVGVIKGGADNDRITVEGSASDTIWGEAGDDVITINPSGVVGEIRPGSGNDTIVIAGQARQINCLEGGNHTVTVSGTLTNNIALDNGNDTVTIESTGSVGGSCWAFWGTDTLNLHKGGSYAANNFTDFEILNIDASSRVTLTGNWALTGAVTAHSGLRVNGQLAAGSVTIKNGATLSGSGNITAPVTAKIGGKVSPGSSTAMLYTGNLTLENNSILEVEINGDDAGTQYDMVKVTGSVTLNAAVLTLAAGYAPAVGDSYVIIDNDGADAVTGQFTGMGEGAIFSRGGRYWQISYAGGTGNDVELTAAFAPDAPVAKSATGVGLGGFRANWGASAGATRYYLDVASNAGFTSFGYGGFQNLNVGNVTARNVTGLTSGRTYYYRLRAYSAAGLSLNSNTISVSTGALPAAPTATAATSQAGDRFRANWVKVAGATAYALDVALDSGFTSFGSGGFNNRAVGDVNNYLATGLSPNLTYYYRVRGVNAHGDGPNSNTVTAYTGTSPPAPVLHDPSNITTSGFTASWSVSSGATRYYLDVAGNAAFTDFSGGGFSNRNVGNVTTYPVGGLTPGQAYYYRVRSYNTHGTSPNSNTKTVTIGKIPAAPTAYSGASISTTGFTARWSASAGADEYYLDLATNTAFTDFSHGGFSNRDVGNVTTYAVTGLTPGQTYYYRLRAANIYGASPNSNRKRVIIGQIPAAPVNGSAQFITTTGFTANWSQSATATTYYLDVALNPGFTNFGSGGLNNYRVGNVTSYNVTGLTPGRTYYVRVRAANDHGTSPNSNTVSAATGEIPAAPNAGAATGAGLNGFTANWSISSGAASYYLDVAADSGFTAFHSGGFSNRAVGNVTSYALSGLSSGITYYYRVRAANAHGTSGNSNVISVTTGQTPAPPLANAASGVAVNGFTASWSVSSGASAYLLDVALDAAFTNFGSGGFRNRNVGNVDTFLVTGLSPGAIYYYRVRASNACGTSGYSNTIHTKTSVLPSAPVATSASSLGTAGFTANWNPSAGAAKYYLDVALDIGFSNFASGGFQNRDVGNSNSYAVAGLTAGATYYYRVRAENSSGGSGNSNTVSVSTGVIPAAPVATSPTNQNLAGFTANWNISSGADNYFLDVALDPAFTDFSSGGFSNRDVGNNVSYTVGGLTAGLTYYYRLRAANAYGASGSFNIKQAVTALVPNKPVAKSATSITITGFVANWDPSPGASKYFLSVATDTAFSQFGSGGFRRRDVGNITSYVVGSPSVSSKMSAAGHFLNSLTPGVTYYYRVTAGNDHGASSESNTVAVSTGQEPAPPLALEATEVGDNGFKANWSLSSGAAEYFLDAALDPAFTDFGSGGFSNLAVGNATGYELSGLEKGLTYYYRVRAANSAGTSANSNTVSQALTDPDGRPVATDATGVSSSGFTANWQAYPDAVGYYLDVASDWGFTDYNWGGFQGRYVSGAAGYTLTGLRSGWTYLYRIRVVTSSGETGYSNVISVRTASTGSVRPPEFAQGLGMSPGLHQDRVALDWGRYVSQAATAAGASYRYRIYRAQGPQGEKALLGETGSTAYDDLSAEPGRRYYYWVTAFNGQGESGYSNYAVGWRYEKNPGRPGLFFNARRKGLLWWGCQQSRMCLWDFAGQPEKSETDWGQVGGQGRNYLKAVADLDGDGQSDLIWVDMESGLVDAWLMGPEGSCDSQDGLPSAVKASGSPGSLAHARQRLMTGDFNGDGKADLLWRDLSSGEAAVWLMDGIAPLLKSPIEKAAHVNCVDAGEAGFDTQSASTGPSLAGSLDWEIAGAADMNGDNMADIVWLNPSSGELAFWMMEGASVSSCFTLLANGKEEWGLAGLSDYDGDHHTDLLWRNNGSGQAQMWLMQGASPKSRIGLTGADGYLKWRIMGSADFDGDGSADIYWRNPESGQVHIWVMDGAEAKEVLAPGAAVDLDH